MEPNSYSHIDLNHQYTASTVSGKNCFILLRNKDEEVQGVVDVCYNRVSRVGGYNGNSLSDRNRLELIKFIRNNKLSLNNDVAIALKLSIFNCEDGKNLYLNDQELQQLLKQNISNSSLRVNQYRYRTLRIQAATKNAVINLSRAATKKLIIEADCNLSIDMRDNPYIESIVIKSGFSGRINASRTAIRQLSIGDNCSCEISLHDSLKSFNVVIGNHFHGILNLHNSLFNTFRIGHFCDASVCLEKNWGHHTLHIGDNFSGQLRIDSVHARNLSIGNNCHGDLFISSFDDLHGLKNLNIKNNFSGTLDLRTSQTVNYLSLGALCSGSIDCENCTSLQIVKFGSQFQGQAIFRSSGLEKLSIAKNSNGRVDVTDCTELSVVKLSANYPINLISPFNFISYQKSTNYISYYFKTMPSSHLNYWSGYKKIFAKVKNYFTKNLP